MITGQMLKQIESNECNKRVLQVENGNAWNRQKGKPDEYYVSKCL